MAEDDDRFEDDFDDEFDDLEPPLDEHETTLVRRDLEDLAEFEATFRPEGYRGVAVFCHDCVEDHYYEWDMLRENLELLIDSGETPVHEPAFAPEPERYVPWEYARGYIDAMRDAGVHERGELSACPRCRLQLVDELARGNFCPRCGSPLVAGRLLVALKEVGLDDDAIELVTRRAGL